MPTYTFRCPECGDKKDQVARIKELDTLKLKMICCSKAMQIVIHGGGGSFQRSPFPKGEWEHLTPDPIQVRDKHHLADLAEANGMRSRLLEDGDVR